MQGTTRDRVVGAIGLAWNLIGIAMFLRSMAMTPEDVAQLPPAQAAFMAAVPPWFDVVYGVAVVAGVLGSVGLIAHRRWALPLYVISLVAVVLQTATVVRVMPAGTAFADTGLPMMLTVTAIAAFLWWYARAAAKAGRLR